jgi:hypothetical protein
MKRIHDIEMNSIHTTSNYKMIILYIIGLFIITSITISCITLNNVNSVNEYVNSTSNIIDSLCCNTSYDIKYTYESDDNIITQVIGPWSKRDWLITVFRYDDDCSMVIYGFPAIATLINNTITTRNTPIPKYCRPTLSKNSIPLPIKIINNGSETIGLLTIQQSGTFSISLPDKSDFIGSCGILTSPFIDLIRWVVV